MTTTQRPTAEGLGLNTFEQAVIANPHRFWKQFRAIDPMIWWEQSNGWFLTKYEDVKSVLRDPARFSSARGGPNDNRRNQYAMRAALAGQTAAAMQPNIGRTILNSDPPDHTRLRRLADRLFTPKSIREMAPHVQEIANDLIEQAVARGDVIDVMDDLAGPLPTIVIAEMLGVSTEDRAKFKRWSTAVTEPFRPETTMEQAQARVAELSEFTEYLTREIAKRREHPADDLIGRLVAARDQADSLSEEELLSFIRLLLVAGNETTTNLIGNAVLALIDHPQEQVRLRRDPKMIDSAIEEFLRYDGSVQFTSRLSTEPVEMHGRKFEAGTNFVTVLASANRDEDVWQKPDDLILDRQPNRHLAFGDWIHVCIGQHLARLETNTSIPALLKALPRLELAVPRDQLVYRPQFNLRGLSHLPVRDAV